MRMRDGAPRGLAPKTRVVYQRRLIRRLRMQLDLAANNLNLIANAGDEGRPLDPRSVRGFAEQCRRVARLKAQR